MGLAGRISGSLRKSDLPEKAIGFADKTKTAITAFYGYGCLWLGVLTKDLQIILIRIDFGFPHLIGTNKNALVYQCIHSS